MVEICSDARCDHGVNMDIWCTDSGGGGTSPSGLHLHHHGGIPRCLHLPHSGGILQASQRCLCQVVEGNCQRVRLAEQVLLNISVTTKCKCRLSPLLTFSFLSLPPCQPFLSAHSVHDSHCELALGKLYIKYS